jgi:hypothetical protein
MWHYKRLPTGYCRCKSTNDKDSYIFDILSNKLNRSIWQRVLTKTVCLVIGHIKGKICVAKGYTKEKGTFELILCDRCRAGILFYEGVRE